MFKKGEYIVTLKVIGDEHNCGKDNYCFKIRETKIGLYPEMDLKGSSTNGYNYMSYDKNIFLKDWRYATVEEINEYDRLGKPYDVTTLISKFEVGKWYRIDHPNFEKYEHICKFLKVEFGKFYYSERIKNYNYENKSDWHAYIKAVKLCTLEEIQQYLPDGHPDKIVKSNDYFDYCGKWYKYKKYPKFLCYIESESRRYGFGIDGSWFEKSDKLFKVEDYQLATEKEVEERLLEYAKKKYPIGIRFNSIANLSIKGIKVIHEPIINKYGSIGTQDNGINGIVYLKDKWAEIISKESQENIIPQFKNLPQDLECEIKSKLLLSIDDEALPMVNVIKTNTIKNLLNNN